MFPHIATSMIQVLTVGSMVGAVKFGSRAFEALSSQTELWDRRALAKQAACVHKLTHFFQHKKDPNENKALPRQYFCCKQKKALGNSTNRARNYWFKHRDEWLYPSWSSTVEADYYR